MVRLVVGEYREGAELVDMAGWNGDQNVPDESTGDALSKYSGPSGMSASMPPGLEWLCLDESREWWLVLLLVMDLRSRDANELDLPDDDDVWRLSCSLMMLVESSPPQE